MDFYMVVQINPDDGTFEDDPEYFDFGTEARDRHKTLTEQHPDLTFAVFRCSDVTP